MVVPQILVAVSGVETGVPFGAALGLPAAPAARGRHPGVGGGGRRPFDLARAAKQIPPGTNMRRRMFKSGIERATDIPSCSDYTLCHANRVP